MTIEHNEFLELDKALLTVIMDAWEPVAQKVLGELLKAYSDDDLQGVWDAINAVDIGEAVQGKKPALKTLNKASLLFGATRLSVEDDLRIFSSDDYNFGMVKAPWLLQLGLDRASVRVREALGQIVNKELEGNRGVVTVLKADVVKGFVSALGGAIEGVDELALAASLHTTRMASFGYLVEATLVGETKYIINALFDSRTCPVCAHLEDKVFEVRTQYDRTVKVFAATTVDELKRLAPWPSQSKAELQKFYSMTAEEIQAAGYGAPPLHPLCRCFLDYVESPKELRETTTTYPDISPLLAGGNIIEGATFSVAVDEVEDQTFS